MKMDSYNVDNKLNSHLENLYISQLNELFYIVIDQIAENYYNLGKVDSCLHFLNTYYQDYQKLSSSQKAY